MFALLNKTTTLNSWLVLVLAFSICAAAQSTGNIGELFASEATPNGPMLLAGTGMAVASGSEVSAGRSSATLRLERGGEVKICPYGHLSVTGDPARSTLMIAMGVSMAELSYPINDLTDILLTPDFRLSLTGPGTFHFAVGVNARGDTCIKPLRGNSAAIVISELMGPGTYTLRADEAAVFPGGKVDNHGPLASPCGCPPPPPPVQQAGARPPASKPVAPAPPSKTPGDVHIQVEAPLVFRGDQPTQQAYSVAKVKFSALPNVFVLQEKVEPTLQNGGVPAQKPKERRGFFGVIKGFFASIFRK